MTCCDWPRMDSKAPMRRGSESLRVRVKAWGNSACRASAENSGERIRSVSWENSAPRVNPYFSCHGGMPCQEKFEEYLIKSITYGWYFNTPGLSSVDWASNAATVGSTSLMACALKSPVK